MPKPVSLRQQLFLWLLVPALILPAFGTSIIYVIVRDFSQHVLDQSVFEKAKDLGHEIWESGSLEALRQMHGGRVASLLKDPFDEVFYSLSDTAGRVIGGDADVPLPPPTGNGGIGMPEVSFYDGTLHRQPVRLVSLWVDIGPNAGGFVRVQVAMTQKLQQTFINEILNVAIAAQLLLLLGAGVVVWFAVGEGLGPLRSLEEKVASLSPLNLSPLDVAIAPVEARGLLEKINHLMGRVQATLDAQSRCTEDSAHQLRSPLAGMKTQIAVGLRQQILPHTRQVLEKIDERVDFLSHTVNQILSMSRSESIRLRCEQPSAVDLNKLARDTTMEWVPTAAEKAVDLGFESSSSKVILQGWADRLQDLLDNLISNAIRFTPNGGEVTVSVETQGETRLAVYDNGMGIPLEERERIFDRFYSIPGRDPRGSGLGLAIVKEIAESHGARVELADGPGNRGTTIKVVFPAEAVSVA